MDLGPRAQIGTRGERARARTVRPGRRGMSERARRRHRRWMRRSAVTAAERGVRLTVRQGTERARLSIIVRRLEIDRREQNIWHFVDSGTKKLLSFIDAMFSIVQHVHALACVPTYPAAPVSGAQLCSRYRRIARFVRIVSFRSSRFFSAPK